MGRPKSKQKFKLFKLTGNPYWHARYFSDEVGKEVRRSTGFRRDEYSKEYVRSIIDDETGTKHVAEYSIDWFEDYNKRQLEIDNASESTRGLYKLSFKYLREVYSCGYSVYKINRSIRDDLSEYLQKQGTGNAGINVYLTHLRAAFERLVINGKLDRNPLSRFKRLRVKKKKQSLTLEEAKHFMTVINGCKNKNLKHLLRISIFTGRRRSEVLSIERQNVDIKNKRYEVVNIKSEDKHKDTREIPVEVIGDFVYFLITYPHSPTPFNVCRPNTFTHWTKKLLREAGLAEDLHLHSLRHTFVTLAKEKGADIRDIQKYLGHTKVSTTELYAHDNVERALKIGLE